MSKRQFLILQLHFSAPLQLNSHPVLGLDAIQLKTNKGDLLLPTAGQMRGHHLHVLFCLQLLGHTKGTAFQDEK